jgi:hypothetical protein
MSNKTDDEPEMKPTDTGELRSPEEIRSRVEWLAHRDAHKNGKKPDAPEKDSTR